MRPGRTSPRRRLVGVLAVFCVLFGGVFARLVQLQLLEPERYVTLGQDQRLRGVTLPAARGAMFDRNGNDLALSVTQRTIWADPRLVTDSRAAAQALAPILAVDPLELQSRLSSPGHFVYVARQVPEPIADQVEELAIDGIAFLDEPARFRPSGDLARALLGSVNLDGVGSSGLELQYDEALTGEPGELVIELDPRGRTIPAGRHQRTPALPGDDLVLSIDRNLQYEVEQTLMDQVDRMGAKGGIAIVTNPATGEILALANIGRTPDAEGLETGPAVPIGNNRALTAVFEPGSANKVITMAAALEEGVATPETILTVPDHLQVADHRFSDHDPHPTAEWSVTEILARSSNIGTIMLGQQLGKDRLDEYLRRFGFGETTGLGFPNESAGLLLDPEDWSGTSIGTIPLGQGIAVTAMQMLSAYNVIANGGVYVEPQLVLATVDEDGRQHAAEPAERRRVVSEATADAVRDMMVTVVEAGTGEAAAIEGYHVAGKTGTARKPLPTGGYRDEAGNFHYVATFAGFVPAEDPQLSAIVVIDEPSATIFASGASAPVFRDIASYALRQFRIPPPAVSEQLVVPVLSGEVDPNAASDVAGGRRDPPPTTLPDQTGAAAGEPPDTAVTTTTTTG